MQTHTTTMPNGIQWPRSAKRVFSLTGPALILAVALVGCGSNYGSDPDTDIDQSGTIEPEGPLVITTSDTELGTILTDGDGNTLYLFTPDAQGESTCYDSCATAWPPFVSQKGAEAEGEVDTGLINQNDRTDETRQLSYNDHPLYYYAEDSAAGDVNGQGLNGKWYVLDADGNAIESSTY